MRIFITGGMGFVGSMLSKALSAGGHEVSVLDRSVETRRPVPTGVHRVQGDSTKEGPWQEELAGHNAVINLAGASIFQRWNDQVKRAIVESRISTTRNVVKALAAREGQETHLFSTSAVGYYGFHGDEILSEDDPAGSDFLARLAVDWETEALQARQYGARVVITRFGLVLGRNGGVLSQLIPLFRRYLGARLGSGRQWFSWIHGQDLTSAFVFLLGRKELDGAVNCTSPNPVRNQELTTTLARLMNRPLILPPVPGFMLRLALGEFGNVLLKGQRVVPGKLADNGFRFRFSTPTEALNDVLAP